MDLNCLVFDIQTVPDVGGARRLWPGLDGLSDEEVAKVMIAKRQQESDGQSESLRHHLQRVCAISAVYRHGDDLEVCSFGDEASNEAVLLQRFYARIESYSPTLVSWNSSGFALPVMHYRALINGLEAPGYWKTAQAVLASRDDSSLAHVQGRHIDLLAVLSAYQPEAVAKLDEVASLMGYPGELGMVGVAVWPTYLAGRLAEIRARCEIDVINTYLVYLRFERMRGHFDDARHCDELTRLRHYLGDRNTPHFKDFLDAWPARL